MMQKNLFSIFDTVSTLVGTRQFEQLQLYIQIGFHIRKSITWHNLDKSFSILHISTVP
jgi:hypothetical protein